MINEQDLQNKMLNKIQELLSNSKAIRTPEQHEHYASGLNKGMAALGEMMQEEQIKAKNSQS